VEDESESRDPSNSGPEIDELPHSVTTAAPVLDHPFDSTNIIDMPPKTFDYAEHQNGLYTPRKWIEDWIDWSKKSFERQVENKNDNETVLPDELSLLISLLSDPNYLPVWHFISEAERAEIQLMNRLDKIKWCPLYVYDTVLEWAKSCLSPPASMEDSDSPLPQMRTRENFLK
jgi:hypothetical protein